MPTFGVCGICAGGGEAKTGLGFLNECYNTCDDPNNPICVCFKCLAICGIAIITVPSLGILQVINKSKCYIATK